MTILILAVVVVIISSTFAEKYDNTKLFKMKIELLKAEIKNLKLENQSLKTALADADEIANKFKNSNWEV